MEPSSLALMTGGGVLIGFLLSLLGAGGSILLSDLRLRQGFSLLLVGTAALTGAEAWQRHHQPTEPSSDPPSPGPPLPISRSALFAILLV